ncbi:MAG: hypothetical protein MJZ49_00680 [Bacteroidales bacterium]|nr:hypothetical protein [Bacteroidales bacterium]
MEQKKSKKAFTIAAIILILLVIAVVVYLLIKSENKKSENSDCIATAAANDSTKNVNEDSIKFVTFTSSDLMMHGLHGKVKRVVYTEGAGVATEITEAVFDTLGIGSSMKINRGEPIVTRNESSQIIRLKNQKKFDNTDEFFNYEYKYNPQGQICNENAYGWEWNFEDKCEWDENGFLQKRSGNDGNEMGSAEFTQTYQYLSFDQYHNWTEAECTVKSRWKEHFGDYEEWETKTIKIKREIEYFPR